MLKRERVFRLPFPDFFTFRLVRFSIFPFLLVLVNVALHAEPSEAWMTSIGVFLVVCCIALARFSTAYASANLAWIDSTANIYVYVSVHVHVYVYACACGERQRGSVGHRPSACLEPKCTKSLLMKSALVIKQARLGTGRFVAKVAMDTAKQPGNERKFFPP